MGNLGWLLAGGFLRPYRTQVLGVMTALGAVMSFAVGDVSFLEFVQHLPIIFGGLAVTALGSKVNDAAPVGSPLAMRLGRHH